MSRKKCIVVGCDSVEMTNHSISFHLLKISDPKMYQQRINAIRVLNNQPSVERHTKSARICSLHFTPDCFLAGLARRLKDNALPTIFPANEKMENVEFNDHQSSSPMGMKEDSEISNVCTCGFEIVETTETCKDSTLTAPQKKIRFRYPGDIENFDKNTRVVKKQADISSKQVNRLKFTNYRQKIKTEKTKDVIFQLCKNGYISEGGEQDIQQVHINLTCITVY